MAAPTPEHLPFDHRFREFQDNHYHDEDDQPGAVPPVDEFAPRRKFAPAPKQKLPLLPRRRRYEED